MSAIAVVFMIIAIVVVWGGLLASALYLRARPEVATYPPGGDDDTKDDDLPSARDT